jgi:hypothetical protein
MPDSFSGRRGVKDAGGGPCPKSEAPKSRSRRHPLQDMRNDGSLDILIRGTSGDFTVLGVLVAHGWADSTTRRLRSCTGRQAAAATAHYVRAASSVRRGARPQVPVDVSATSEGRGPRRSECLWDHAGPSAKQRATGGLPLSHGQVTSLDI